MQTIEFESNRKIYRIEIIAFFRADTLTILPGLIKVYAHLLSFFIEKKKLDKIQRHVVSWKKYKVWIPIFWHLQSLTLQMKHKRGKKNEKQYLTFFISCRNRKNTNGRKVNVIETQEFQEAKLENLYCYVKWCFICFLILSFM